MMCIISNKYMYLHVATKSTKYMYLHSNEGVLEFISKDNNYYYMYMYLYNSIILVNYNYNPF